MTERASEVGAVGRYLGELLASEPYRQRWLAYAKRTRGRQVNSAAVAEVLTLYLWDAGLRSEQQTELPRQLKDRVSRALRGEIVSAETLSWFTHAFGIDRAEETELWRLFGEAVVEEEPEAGRQHRTVSLHELHYVGADGLPEHHETTQVIKALVDGLDHYTYIFDTNEAEVSVVRGGTAGPLYDFSDGLFAVDVAFHHPLTRGEVGALTYITRFHYREAPEPAFRRQARRLVENLELRVAFHPQRLPERVWWTEWQGLTWEQGEPPEPQVLDADHAVQRYLTSVREKTVGFVWDFGRR